MMEPIIFICISLLGTFLFYMWQQNTRDREEVEEILENVRKLEEEKKANSYDFEGDTRHMLLWIIRKQGWEHKEIDENRLTLNYQGETFIVETTSDNSYITIRDPWWYDLPMDGDIEDFARLQKAINRINAFAPCTVLYTLDEEERRIGVHSSKNMIFVPQIPHLENYLTTTLNDFFKVQRAVLVEIERYKAAECGKTSS